MDRCGIWLFFFLFRSSDEKKIDYMTLPYDLTMLMVVVNNHFVEKKIAIFSTNTHTHTYGLPSGYDFVCLLIISIFFWFHRFIAFSLLFQYWIIWNSRWQSIFLDSWNNYQLTLIPLLLFRMDRWKFSCGVHTIVALEALVVIWLLFMMMIWWWLLSILFRPMCIIYLFGIN